MVAVGGGPEVRAGRKRKFKVSWEGSTDFVLAYKVSKVKVDKEGNVKEEKEDRKGAFLEHESEEGQPAAPNVTIVQRPEPDVKCSAFTVAEGDDTQVIFGVLEDE